MRIRAACHDAALALALAAALGGGPVVAQTAPDSPASRDAIGATPLPGTGASTPNDSRAGGGNRREPPVPGANSFTEGQARSRMAAAGFNDVQDLTLDEQGIWRARGMRNGQQVGVALDYQGNVVATREGGQ